MLTLNDLVMNQIGHNSNDFYIWAFGEGYNDLTMPELMKRWNEKHGHKFLLEFDGNPYIDILKMIDIWKEEN